MGFCNSTVKPAVLGKPHIVKRDGLWRVSPYDSVNRSSDNQSKWAEAHKFTDKLNKPILDNYFVRYI